MPSQTPQPQNLSTLSSTSEMADPIFSYYANLILDKLNSAVLTQLKFSLGVDHELETISSNLAFIQTQHTSKSCTKDGLESLLDVLFDLNDLLDDTVAQAALEDVNKGHWPKELRRLFSAASFRLQRKQWAQRIKKNSKKLDQIVKVRMNRGLISGSVGSSEEKPSAYDSLPSYVKLCLSICSVYKKGATLYRSRMLCLWMALGFLPEGELQLEHIGKECVDQLLSKSLLQRLGDDPFGSFSDFVMQDSAYDLAKSVVHEETGYITLEDEDLPRELCLDEELLLMKMKHACLLRLNTSKHPLTKTFLKRIISASKYLRVLDLGDAQFEKLPGTIGYSRNLRFLSLQNNTRIKRLPSSISNLSNLQTLILDGCSNLQQLPADVGKLARLRYLSVTIQQRVLPEGIGHLKALRTLNLIECPRLAFLPPSMRQLENLEELHIFDCEELDMALEGIRKLRVLVIAGLKKLQTLPLNTKGFSFLHTLVIGEMELLSELGDGIFCYGSLKEVMISTCPNLERLPQSFGNLKKLEVLCIEDCPKLSKRCATERGEDWHLICSIPSIEIDGRKIVKDYM